MYVFEGQWTTCGRFSPSTTWVSGMKFRSSVSEARTLTSWPISLIQPYSDLWISGSASITFDLGVNFSPGLRSRKVPVTQKQLKDLGSDLENFLKLRAQLESRVLWGLYAGLWGARNLNQVWGLGVARHRWVLKETATIWVTPRSITGRDTSVNEWTRKWTRGRTSFHF